MLATVSPGVTLASLASLTVNSQGKITKRLRARPYVNHGRVASMTLKRVEPVSAVAPSPFDDTTPFDFEIVEDTDAPTTPEEIAAYGREYELSEHASGAYHLSVTA